MPIDFQPAKENKSAIDFQPEKLPLLDRVKNEAKFAVNNPGGYLMQGVRDINTDFGNAFQAGGQAIANTGIGALNMLPGVNIPKRNNADLSTFSGMAGNLVGEGVTTAIGGAGVKAAGLLPKMIDVGKMAGAKASTYTGNKVLDYLNKQSAKGGALTPEEAAQNLAKNYTNMEGKPMGTDIGTLTNNPLLRNTNEALKFVPFSGASQNANQVTHQIADRDISLAEGALKEGLTKTQSEEKIVADKIAQQKLEAESLKKGLSTQKDTYASNPEATRLNDSINAILEQRNKYNIALDEIPKYVNNLASSAKDRANITGELRDSLSSTYRGNKSIAKENYAPINDSKLRLDDLGVPNSFNGYKTSAAALLAEKENLKNLFGSDSDLGSRLNAELSKAENFMSGDKANGVTLGEAVGRLKNIGKLASSARGQGNNREAMLLEDLKNSLSTDVNSVLNASGHSELASTLLKANDYYRDNVVPFWRNPEIRKSVLDKNYVPQNDKLSKALHDSNNHGILNQLPIDSRNMSLYQLLTKGKGTSDGMSNMTPQQYGDHYAGMPVDTKKAIASYNAKADSYLETLPTVIKTRDQLEGAHEYLRGQLDTLKADIAKNSSTIDKQIEKLSLRSDLKSEKEIANLEKLKLKNQGAVSKLEGRVESAKNNKYNAEKAGDSLSKKIPDYIKGGVIAGGLGAGLMNPVTLALTVPGVLASRSLSKILSDPKLVEAYINRTKLSAKTPAKKGGLAGI